MRSRPDLDRPLAGPVLCGITAEPLDPSRVSDAVASTSHGAAVVFTGIVRDHDDDRGVELLEYEAHPSAAAVLADVLAHVAAAHPGVALAAQHRTGRLAVGDAAVVVAAGSAHRGEAFAAASALIDAVKDRVPIWKHQRFTDGSEEWVGSP